MRETPTSEARFRAAFDAYFEHVNRYCLRRIPSVEVNDTVADVFMVAWRKVDQMPDGAVALPWLYGVARLRPSPSCWGLNPAGSCPWFVVPRTR